MGTKQRCSASNTARLTEKIRKSRRRDAAYAVLYLGLLAITFGIAGCHSAYVNATVSNRSASTISVVQVEYPSASFGTQSIAPGHDFKYRFKVLGSGAMKIVYTDSARAEHTFAGPSLKEGDEGSLAIIVSAGKLDWNFKLAH